MSGVPRTVYQYCKRCGEVSAKIMTDGLILWGFHRCADLPPIFPCDHPHMDALGVVQFVENIEDKRGES